MSHPPPIVECVPVVSGASTVFAFFRTDMDSAGHGHGRCRLAEFSSAVRARQFGMEAQTGNAIVKGLDRIEPGPTRAMLAGDLEW